MEETIENRIMLCNPIMEAFGNAKTVKNNNSSRFGKYVSILVEGDSQRIKGAFINKYLLEKSRVTHIAKEERNYHVFYQLLSNKELSSSLGLSSDPSTYLYLSQSQVYKVDTIDDSVYFQELKNSFIDIGLNSDQVNAIWSTIAALLLCGKLLLMMKNDLFNCINR